MRQQRTPQPPPPPTPGCPNPPLVVSECRVVRVQCGWDVPCVLLLVRAFRVCFSSLTTTTVCCCSFAKTVVAPKVKEMDQSGVMCPDLIQGLFDNGLMAIEIPEEFGGVGTFPTSHCSTLAVWVRSPHPPSALFA